MIDFVKPRNYLFANDGQQYSSLLNKGKANRRLYTTNCVKPGTGLSAKENPETGARNPMSRSRTIGQFFRTASNAMTQETPRLAWMLQRKELEPT